jgi:hypothetical protein
MDDQHTTPAQVNPMPFTEKFANVFASPGELFENVRLTNPTTSNWLVPWIIFVVVAIIMGQLMVHNASLADQLGTMIKKGFDKQVQEGKMPQERAEQVYEQFAKPGSMWFTLAQVGGVTVGSLVALFVLGLLYWLVGKTAMGATAPYMKVVEVVGLLFFIIALEQIVTTLLMFALDSIYATPSLGIFVSSFNVENKLHVALSKINVFTIWVLCVLSIGLAKLFQRDFPKVLVLVFTLWILWSLVTIFTGFKFGG